MTVSSATSTRPYLMRAIYEWCVDNGFTPYIAVAVDEHTIVPREHVRDGEIVLNIGTGATNRLSIGNDLVTFQARFSGAVRELSVPIDNVSAIYARENGHGMAFEVPKETGLAPQPKPTATPSGLGAMMAIVSPSTNAAKPEAIDEEPKPPDGNGSSPDSGGQPRQRGRAKLTRIK
jgi:stringent starvation protein B